MKSIKTLMHAVITGFTAITGISGLLNGCSEDTDTKPVTRITSEQLKTCCGENDRSAEYYTCVADYQASGVCSKTDPCADGGCIIPPYGIIPHYDECCGVDDGSKAWTKCVEDYQKTGLCSKGDPCADGGCDGPEFPLFDTSDEDARACCGEDTASKEYQQCREDMDLSCGYSKTEKAFKACIEKYKADNSCSV